MAWSTHEPGGGEPGKKLRSGTMANSIAAYHVENGGKNDVLPNAIGMATINAKAGRADEDQAEPQVENQWALGPVQRDDHVVQGYLGCGVLGVVDAGDAHVPAVQLSGYFHTGPWLCPVLASAGEHVGRDFVGFVRVEWPVSGIAVRLDRGADLRWRFSLPGTAGRPGQSRDTGVRQRRWSARRSS